MPFPYISTKHGVWGSLPQEGAEVFRWNGAETKLEPFITILTIFIGREFVLEKWINSLRRINHPKKKMSLLWVYAGKPNSKFSKLLRMEMENLAGYHSKSLVCHPRLPRFLGSDGRGRHQAICSTYNFSKVYIEASDFVFLLEDDVVAPPDILSKLLRLMRNPRIGCAIGNLRYRPMDGNHGTPLAWEIVPTYETQNGTLTRGHSVWAVPPQDDGVEEVSSGTFGCALVREPLWRGTDLVPWSETIFGTDVNFGHQIREKGYKTMIDWSVRCRHYFQREGELCYA